MPYINGERVNYDHLSKRNIKHFKSSLNAVLNNRINEYLNKFTSQSADAFANGVRNRLLRNATPNDEHSQALIQQIANSIYVDHSDDERSDYHYAKVHIPIDKQNLVLYLEYGTGLEGFENPHPETKGGRGKRQFHRVIINENGKGIVWKYASNYATKYKKVKNPIDVKKGYGFFFTKTNLAYVTKGDLNPTWWHTEKKAKDKIIVKRTKPYGPDKLGRIYKNGRTYKIKQKGITHSYDYYYDSWVWSRGIKPVRFIYDTKKAYAMAISKYGVGGGTKYYNRLPDKARNIIEGVQ